ncbi:MAG: hypothetical protein WA960_02675 [Tunicatimonas sp.]
MKRFFTLIVLSALLTVPAWAQEFCTCNLQRLTSADSDTLVYVAAISVFPEAETQEVFFAVDGDEETGEFRIRTNISDKVYSYDKDSNVVSDAWGDFGEAASIKKSLMEVLSKDLMRVHCSNIYLDKRTYDFSSILSFAPQ